MDLNTRKYRISASNAQVDSHTGIRAKGYKKLIEGLIKKELLFFFFFFGLEIWNIGDFIETLWSSLLYML